MLRCELGLPSKLKAGSARPADGLIGLIAGLPKGVSASRGLFLLLVAGLLVVDERMGLPIAIGLPVAQMPATESLLRLDGWKDGDWVAERGGVSVFRGEGIK